MSHACAVPAAKGNKRQTWRCPTCRTKWDFVPGARGSGLFGDRRHGDGSPTKPWWRS